MQKSPKPPRRQRVKELLFDDKTTIQNVVILKTFSEHAIVAIGNPERHVRKASHRGSKQQQRSCSHLSSRTLVIMFNRSHVNIGRATTSQSLLLLLAHATQYTYDGVILPAHPVRGESHNQRNTTGEVATLLYVEPLKLLPGKYLCLQASHKNVLNNLLMFLKHLKL